MNNERNLGVTEAGLGLAILICLLVVFGYVVLHQLAGSGQAPIIEVRHDIDNARPAASSAAADVALEQPQVLPVDRSDSAAHALRAVPEEVELR